MPLYPYDTVTTDAVQTLQNKSLNSSNVFFTLGTDTTKKLAFVLNPFMSAGTATINATNLAAGQTCTLTSGVMVSDAGIASFTNKVWDTAGDTNIIADGGGGGAFVFFHPNPGGGSPVGEEAFHYLTFLNSSFNDQTHTFPDATGVIVQDVTAQTLTNKTMSGASNTFSNIARSSIASGTARHVVVNDASGNLTSIAPGSAGNLLKSDGTSWTSAGPTVPTVQRLTSGSGTYTTPAGCRWLRIRMIGGGSGGGGGGSSSDSTAGADGNDTTWKVAGGAAFLTAGKGLGSRFNAAGGANTTGSPATVIISATGATGAGFEAKNLVLTYLTGGVGGASLFGGNGTGVANSTGTAAIANSGSGGGGGGTNNSAADSYSGTGGAAGGYIEATIASPSATYDYVVGAGGSGGSAGTAGFAGGAGGSGVIIVEEFY